MLQAGKEVEIAIREAERVPCSFSEPRRGLQECRDHASDGAGECGGWFEDHSPGREVEVGGVLGAVDTNELPGSCLTRPFN